MQQKQLADLMGINPCYVSTLERGRKGPPSKAVLKRLIKNLNLSQDEQERLWYSKEPPGNTERRSGADYAKSVGTGFWLTGGYRNVDIMGRTGWIAPLLTQVRLLTTSEP